MAIVVSTPFRLCRNKSWPQVRWSRSKAAAPNCAAPCTHYRRRVCVRVCVCVFISVRTRLFPNFGRPHPPMASPFYWRRTFDGVQQFGQSAEWLLNSLYRPTDGARLAEIGESHSGIHPGSESRASLASHVETIRLNKWQNWFLLGSKRLWWNKIIKKNGSPERSSSSLESRASLASLATRIRPDEWHQLGFQSIKPVES